MKPAELLLHILKTDSCSPNDEHREDVGNFRRDVADAIYESELAVLKQAMESIHWSLKAKDGQLYIEVHVHHQGGDDWCEASITVEDFFQMKNEDDGAKYFAPSYSEYSKEDCELLADFLGKAASHWRDQAKDGIPRAEFPK